MTDDKLGEITERDEETDGGEIQRYDPRQAVPAAESIGHAADAMEEFNRLLWQIAKAMWIITGMLLGVSFIVMAYYAAEFLATL